MSKTFLTEHFTLEEFQCKCGCGKNFINQGFVEVLELVRRDLGKPMVVTSGYRCLSHNQAVGGKPNSAHTRGFAADIAANSQEAYQLVALAMKHGVKRVGIAKNFVHLDMDTTLLTPALWQYGV